METCDCDTDLWLKSTSVSSIQPGRLLGPSSEQRLLELGGGGGRWENSLNLEMLPGPKMRPSLPKWLIRQASSICLPEIRPSLFQSLHICEPPNTHLALAGRTWPSAHCLSVPAPDSRPAGGAPRPSSSARGCC